MLYLPWFTEFSIPENYVHSYIGYSTLLLLLYFKESKMPLSGSPSTRTRCREKTFAQKIRCFVSGAYDAELPWTCPKQNEATIVNKLHAMKIKQHYPYIRLIFHAIKGRLWNLGCSVEKFSAVADVKPSP